MEEKINIAEILKNKPKGTKLYADAFESLQEIESLIKNLKKKFSSKDWKVEIRRNY